MFKCHVMSPETKGGMGAQMADMHVGRGSLCTAMQGYTLWAVGGRDSHTFHNSTECFHAGQNRWTWGPPTTTKRFAAAGGCVNNAIYTTGGFDATTYTAQAERLDPREGKWVPVSLRTDCSGETKLETCPACT